MEIDAKKQKYIIFGILLLFYILIILVYTAVNFSYSNFWGSLVEEGNQYYNYFGIIFYFFVFLCFLAFEEYLSKRISSEKSNKILYLKYFIFLYASIVIVRLILITIFLAIGTRCIDLCPLEIYLYAPYQSTVIVLILLRILILRATIGKIESNSMLFINNIWSKHVLKHSKKILTVLFVISLILSIAIFFDYKTHGKYIKISRESNEHALIIGAQEKALEKNDINLCHDSLNVHSCLYYFFSSKADNLKKENIKDLSSSYLLEFNNYCQKIKWPNNSEGCTYSVYKALGDKQKPFWVDNFPAYIDFNFRYAGDELSIFVYNHTDVSKDYHTTKHYYINNIFKKQEKIARYLSQNNELGITASKRDDKGDYIMIEMPADVMFSNVDAVYDVLSKIIVPILNEDIRIYDERGGKHSDSHVPR